MQRQIKFRIWDKSLNKYVYTNNGYYICESETGGYKLVFNLNDDCWKGDYIIQQFTGLLDKNGKEIFEGDIIKYREIYIVSIHENKVFHIREVKYKSPTFYIDGERAQFGDCEIIGNIFENPDILSKNE